MLRKLLCVFVAVSGAMVLGDAVGQTVTPRAAADVSAMPTGAYQVDVRHTAVIARVSHMGLSYSVFRFDDVSGTLDWNGEHPSISRLAVQVATGSIVTPVEGFAAELAGDRYLKSGRFPFATFQSTAFRQISSTTGQVEGELTLLGVMKPATFHVELVGAGRGMSGQVIGVHATAVISPQDFGFPPMLSTPVEIVIDTEFVSRGH